MNGYRQILAAIASIALKAKNNPDFALAVSLSYGLMGLQVLLQIFLMPLYLGAFDGYRFGALMMLISYVGIVLPLATALYSVVLRLFGEAEVSGNPARFGALYYAGRIAFLTIGLACGVGLLIVEVGHPVLFDDAAPDIRSELIVTMLLSILHLLLMCDIAVAQALLAASHRQTAVSLVILTGLMAFALSVVPVLLLDGSLVEVMLCFIVGDIVSRVFATFCIRRLPLRPIRPSWPKLVTALRGIVAAQAWRHFSLTLISAVLQADVIIVGLLGGPLAAASFVLVWKIAELLILLLSRVTWHLQVEFVRMDLREQGDRLLRVYNNTYAALLAGALVCALAYGLLGHWVVGLWVGAEAVPDESWAYPLAGASVLFLAMARLPITVALSLNRVTLVVYLVTIEMIAKLLLIYLLFDEYGILAPLIAISVTHLCGLAYGYYAMGRHLVMRPLIPGA